MTLPPPPPPPGNFAPTRWTLVLRARGQSPEARQALCELCETYYQPVLRFLCREGRTADEARELAQEFFKRVLSGQGLNAADSGRGRFRSFVLGAVKHFLADVYDHAHRLKRGGGRRLESLDAERDPHATTGLHVPDPSTVPTDAVFDRAWALTVVDHALQALEGELTAQGKQPHFDALKPWLVGDNTGAGQADAARQLGLSGGALKVAVHRLRKRFRELVRNEINQTVGDPTAAQEELRYLIEVLSHPALD